MPSIGYTGPRFFGEAVARARAEDEQQQRERERAEQRHVAQSQRLELANGIIDAASITAMPASTVCAK
jgi:hypothetical protein